MKRSISVRLPCISVALFLLVLLVLSTCNVVFAAEATRSLDSLKGAVESSPVTDVKSEASSPPVPSPVSTPAAVSSGGHAGQGDATPAETPGGGIFDLLGKPVPTSEMGEGSETGLPPGFLSGAKESGEPSGEIWKEDPKRGRPSINLLLTVVSLLVICVVAYVCLKLYSMYVGTDQQSAFFKKKIVQIRERHMLGPNKMLCLVELPDRLVLLGICENDIKILTEIPPGSLDEGELTGKPEVQTQPTAASYLADVLFRRGPGNK